MKKMGLDELSVRNKKKPVDVALLPATGLLVGEEGGGGEEGEVHQQFRTGVVPICVKKERQRERDRERYTHTHMWCSFLCEMRLDYMWCLCFVCCTAATVCDEDIFIYAGVPIFSDM